jgi:hypothetical protein
LVVSREDFVIPFAVKFIAENCQLCHVLIRDFDACAIERIVYLGLNCEPLFSACVSNAVYDLGSAFQSTTTPILADMAEHAMFDLVPLAGARREVTDMDGHVEFFSKLLDLDFPEAYAAAIATSPIGCN